MSTRTPSARDRILDAASASFYREGIRAVGVDSVIADAGVAKATLYRHFPSKDALVLAFLERRDARWRSWFVEAVERISPDRAGRPLAVFDALAEWFSSEDFRGCAFLNAAAEIADPAHPARGAVRLHEERLAAHLGTICSEAGLPDPSAAAADLFLLVEGAIVCALVEGTADPAARARAAAARLLPRPTHPIPEDR
jgi:AcrR family transcriptional regulator